MPKRSLAAVMTDGSGEIAYQLLESRSLRLARFLETSGLAPGDRVAILMENRIEWLIAMWGVRRAEMLFVPVNWHLHIDEVRYVLENSGVRVLIASARLAELAVAASAEIDHLVATLSVGGGASLADFATALNACSDAPREEERDGGAMPYSSGTTGYPKGIMRAPPGVPFAEPSSLEAMLMQLYAIDANAVYLSPAPQYHSSPVGFTNTVLVAGGTIALMPHFDAEAALAAIERHRVSHAQFVPTHFSRLLALPEEVRTRYDLSSLRVVVHAAAPCPPPVKRGIIEWLGPIVYEYYSGSERCGFTAIDSAEWLAHPGSVGRSLSGPIHILDLETGAELPTGEIGGVYFENPVPFEYHGDPEKTAAVFDIHGWGTHGDVGHVDEEGYLYLSDRRSDLILSGGVNIYPQEVENVLLRHPAVTDAAVIGVADADFGQSVRAVVQLEPGALSVDEDGLIAHCRAHIAGFKCPRSIRFTDELPRLPSGKLLRREVAARYG